MIGLYLEGIIFRWHPYHDETQEVHAGANSFAVSQDAKCLATGDPNGIIKLFGMADFGLVYQFASQDPVFDVCFAPDSRRLYDVRGSHGNVWEPNALIKLSESTEINDDSVSVKSLSSQLTMLKNMPGKIDPVAALVPQPSGSLYCSGTKGGLIEIFEASRGKIAELRRSKSFMGIEHIVWSHDRTLVAFADLCGRLFVRSVPSKAEGGFSPAVETKLDMAIDVTEGSICQIVFHPDSKRLLIYSPSTAIVVSLVTESIIVSHVMELPRVIYRWINHPSDQNSLLAFSPCTVHVWSWQGLVETTTLAFACPITNHGINKTHSGTSSSANLLKPNQSVDRVLVTVDRTCVVLQCSCRSAQGEEQRETLLFDISTIPVAAITNSPSDSEHTQPQSSNIQTSSPHVGSSQSLNSPTVSAEDFEQLEPIPLPPELVSCVEIPLAFLSRDRLVCLDHNYWLCSWRLPLPSKIATRRPSGTGTLDGGTAEIERHYFFPGDWISSESVALCTIMADGTVLCPRKGDVAVVEGA